MGLGHLVGSRLFILRLCIATLVIPVKLSTENKQMLEVFSWSSLDFDFPTSEERDAAIYVKSFIPDKILLLDVDFYECAGGTARNSLLLVTIPRFQRGVPVTLGYVTGKMNAKGNPLIAPYPSWSMQNPGPECLGITSALRLAIDSSERLWVLDAGKILKDQICPPKFLVFSLKTDRLLKQYVFPKDQYTSASLFNTFVIDERDDSGNVFIYISDINGCGLVVYDEANDRSWRIVNNLFYPYPDHGTIRINDDSAELMNGIFSLAIGPILPNGDRILYFHALSSVVESYVPTSVIRNYALFYGQPQASPRSFRSFNLSRSSQSATEAMASNGVLFHSLLSDVAIGCWNTNQLDEFGNPIFETIVRNKETLEFPAGMKVVKRRGTNSEELWVVSNRFQKIAAGGMFDPTEINFRIQRAGVDYLVEGTSCQPCLPHY